MRKTFIDDNLEQEFLENGYVYHNLLSDIEVEDVLRKLKKLRPDDSFNPNIDKYHASDFHCTFLDSNVEYKKAVGKLMIDVFQTKINQIVNNYKILNGNFYVKPPNKGYFALHQNWSFLEKENIYSLTFWCPLLDTNVNNGTLHVIPGSHKMSPDIALPNTIPFFRGIENEIWNKYAVEIPVKAGDCLIFCDTLLHGSPINKSNLTRTAIQIATIPEEVNPVIYFMDYDNPSRLETYKVDSDFFVDNNLIQVKQRPKNLEFVKYIENPNKEVILEEFEKLIQNAERRRKVVFS